MWKRTLPEAILALMVLASCGKHNQIVDAAPKTIADATVAVPTADLQDGAGNKISAGERLAYRMAMQTGDSVWQKRYWLEKAARVLRNGNGLAADENIDELMKLSKTQIVDRLMADPRFLDAVLDFNLYFVGFKAGDLRDRKGNFREPVYESANAIASVQELAKSGDYLTLFDLLQNPFAPPIDLSAQPPVDPTAPQQSLTDLKKNNESLVQADLQKVIDLAAANPPPDVERVCKRFDAHLDFAEPLLNQLNGFYFPLFPEINIVQVPYIVLQKRCQAKPTLAEVKQWLTERFQANQKFFAAVERFEMPGYAPHGVDDLRRFDLSEFGIKNMLGFGIQEAIALANSSTNMNRKRSAYILKHYFCDDLNPVGLENPEQHAGEGQHASDPSCFACHYKLDPMAGFFRDYGSIFINFAGLGSIFFDDGASTVLQTYENNWKAPADSGREWNIGYVRAVGHPEVNSYGESIADLSRIIREAPEAKSCLVRRLFSYLIAEDQVIDGGYLDFLSKSFTAEAQSNSSVAFRHVVKSLVLSESFATTNLNPEQCYDYAPGADPSASPPCRVAYMLEQNCKQCHQSTSGSGNLDVTKWILLPDGSKTFPHLDEKGQQISARDTFSDISNRLSTSDSDERMPQKKIMSSQDRRDLYNWAQEMLNGLPTPGKSVAGGER